MTVACMRFQRRSIDAEVEGKERMNERERNALLLFFLLSTLTPTAIVDAEARESGAAVKAAAAV